WVRVAVADQISDAARDDARFSRARSGENQQGALHVGNGLFLFGSQGVQETHVEAGGQRPEARERSKLNIVPGLQPPTSSLLFNRDALRQIPRLIDVAATAGGNVISEQRPRQGRSARGGQL